MMNRLLADSVRFASFRFPYVVDSLIVGYPAASAGLQVGDSITHLDGKSIAYYDFKEEMLKRKKANASHEVTLTYVRNGVTDTLSMITNADYEIGVAARTATDKLLPVVRKEYSFLSSFPAGVSLGVKTLKGYVGQMKYLFSKEGAKQLGGFGTIGSIFPATWDWHQFWYMTAFLSIILAFMNIPAHPRTGRRTRVIPHLRNHCTPQAQRQVYGTCADGGHVPLVRFADLGKLQRYTEVFLLKNKT